VPDGTSVFLDMDLNDDGSFTAPEETAYATSTLSDGTATFTLAGLPDGTYNLRSRVGDQAGSEGTSDVATVVIDTVAPTISISVPSISSTEGDPVYYTVTYDDLHFSGSMLSPDDITLNCTGTPAARWMCCITRPVGVWLSRTSPARHAKHFDRRRHGFRRSGQLCALCRAQRHD